MYFDGDVTYGIVSSGTTFSKALRVSQNQEKKKKRKEKKQENKTQILVHYSWFLICSGISATYKIVTIECLL